MNRFGLRSRFLAVRLLIAGALTVAVIFVVRFSFARRAGREMRAELAACKQRAALLGAPRADTQTAQRLSQICGMDIAIVDSHAILASTLGAENDVLLVPQLAAIN